jgi:CBS domain-containing protein
MTKVSEIMSKNIVTVPRKKGLKEIIRIMASSRISSIIITEDERVHGILTERDLIKKILLPGKDVAKVTVDDVMTHDPISVNSVTTLSEASHMMKDKNIRHIPIVDNGKLVGLVTQTDIVKETHNIHQKNVKFMTYQNIQTIIIVIFFLFLVGFLVYKKFF